MAQIKYLYVERGWTMARLADYYGCGEMTIRRRLREAGVASRARGPAPLSPISVEWTSDLAYAVGLIATDGNLSSDGRHMSVVSKD